MIDRYRCGPARPNPQLLFFLPSIDETKKTIHDHRGGAEKAERSKIEEDPSPLAPQKDKRPDPRPIGTPEANRACLPACLPTELRKADVPLPRPPPHHCHVSVPDKDAR